MSDNRVGLLLVGGHGTRLFPATSILNKHLFPVYDKPMVYYSLSLLMLAKIREVIVISTKDQLPHFRALFGNGDWLGMRFKFAEQTEPRGIADAFVVAADVIAGRDTALVLGDNLLYGMGLTNMFGRAGHGTGATIFSYPVHNAHRFGIVELDVSGRPINLSEKPLRPRSNLAVPGFYFHDARAPEFARSLQPSERGELEISDLNRCYLECGDLHVVQLGRGTAWLDMGTWDSLVDATNFVASIEGRQGLKIGCIEEIAWRNGWLNDHSLEALIETMPEGNYRNYLAGFIKS